MEPICSILQLVNQLNETTKAATPWERTDILERKLAASNLNLSHYSKSPTDLGNCLPLFTVCHQRGCPMPPVQFRPFATTVFATTSVGTAILLGRGPPEIYPPTPAQLTDALEKVATGEYRMEPIMFGTVCYLYYISEGWMLATKRRAKTINMSLRVGAPAFLKAFYAALEQYEDDGWKGVQSLNKDYTYGFVFHDRRMHVFQASSSRSSALWHVSTFDRTKGIMVPSIDIGIPHPPDLLSTLPTSVNNSVNNSANNSAVEERRKTVAALCQQSTTSIENYAVEKPFLGFVLRNTRDYSGRTPDFIIKSPLYAFIERQLGTLAPLRTVIAKAICMSYEERLVFSRTFPQLGRNLSKAEQARETIIKCVQLHHSTVIGKGSGSTSTKDIVELYNIALGPKFSKSGRVPRGGKGVTDEDTLEHILRNSRGPIATKMSELIAKHLSSDIDKNEEWKEVSMDTLFPPTTSSSTKSTVPPPFITMASNIVSNHKPETMISNLDGHTRLQKMSDDRIKVESQAAEKKGKEGEKDEKEKGMEKSNAQ